MFNAVKMIIEESYKKNSDSDFVFETNKEMIMNYRFAIEMLTKEEYELLWGVNIDCWLNS